MHGRGGQRRRRSHGKGEEWREQKEGARPQVGGQVGRARAPSPSVTFYGKARGAAGRREAGAGARGGGAALSEAGAWGAQQVSGCGVGVPAVRPRQGHPQVAAWATLGHRAGPSLALLGGSGRVLSLCSLVPGSPRISALGDSRRLSAGPVRWGHVPALKWDGASRAEAPAQRTAFRTWIEL